jgi:cytochrome b
VNAPAVVRVWDLPTRVFHAALALTVTAAIVTAEVGGDWMAWHLVCGEAAMSLLVFRWIWGFAGGYWSRFAQFLPTPKRIARHLRAGTGTGAGEVGHNPLGTLSVWAFLLLLSLQVATGLVADDDVATTGPLNAHVGTHLARRASGWHAGCGAELIFALIALHVLAIGWHTWRKPLHKRVPLARAMWSGDKPAPPATRASRDTAATRLLALAIWALAAGGVGWMVRAAG